MQNRFDPGPLPLQFQVKIARGDQDLTRPQQHAVGRFANIQGTFLIQPICQMPSKHRRHVLHDGDRDRKIFGQVLEHGRQCLRPAGRRTNHQNIRALGQAIDGLGFGNLWG
jgi:hypothetical protein